MKQFFVLLLLFATPIVAQITDPFPAIQEGAFYEYKYTPLGGSNNTTLSICVLRYTNFRIEIYNVTKSSNVIKFTYNLTQEEYADGELVSTGWAVFDVNVPVNTSDINGWWINVNKGREAFEELVYGFAGAVLADKIIINETIFEIPKYEAINFTIKYQTKVGAIPLDNANITVFGYSNYSIISLTQGYYNIKLIAINERANLLRFGKNYITIFKEILTRDWSVRGLYDEFIDSEGADETLSKLMDHLFDKYSKNFSSEFCPSSTEKDEYLADIIQFLGATEA